jgi:hypothetical protein
MSILVKPILFCGTQVVLACDGLCEKAWGINNRPQVQLSDDPDDFEYLADDELGEAPHNPGTYEGRDGKPEDYDDPERQNRWCARECERHRLVQVGVVNLPDFTKRVRNIPEHVREARGFAR